MRQRRAAFPILLSLLSLDIPPREGTYVLDNTYPVPVLYVGVAPAPTPLGKGRGGGWAHH